MSTRTSKTGSKRRASRRKASRTARARARTKAQLVVLQQKTATVVDLMGSKAELARVLGVSRTQPGRWISGDEVPSPAMARRLIDLEYLMSRVAAVWDEDLVVDWMTAPNPFLNGAIPLHVVRLHGPSEVIAAIDAQAAGSYA